MKLKMYLRMLLAAVAALFVATACDDSDDKTEPVGPGVEEIPLTFEIAVSNIEGSKASMSVTPNVQLATYYWSAVKKSIYDDLGSDEAFLEDDLAFIQRDATANQMTLSAYLQWVTGRGTVTYTLTGLEAETEYYAYVYGINTDGTVTSGLTKVLFTSGEGEGDNPGPGPGGDSSFAITISDITATSATANVVPEDKTSYYWLCMLSSSQYQQYKDELAEIIAEDVLYMKEAAEEYYGQTFDMAMIVDAFGYQGDESIVLSEVYNMSAGTTYYVFVAGVDETSGAVTTSVAVADPFTTSTAAGDGPEVSITMKAGDRTGANKDNTLYAVIDAPNGDVASGKFGVWETSYVQSSGKTPAEIIASGSAMSAQAIEYINGGGVGYTVGGSDKPLDPNTSYTAIVMVMNADGGMTVETAVASTTDGQGGGETDDFKVGVEMIAGNYSTGALSSQTNSVTAVFFVETGTAVSGKYLVAQTASVQNLINQGATYEQIVDVNGDAFEADELTKFNGDGIGWYWGNLTPGTSYTAIVMGTDADGNTSVAHTAVTTATDGGGGDEEVGPEFTLELKLGESTGANPDTKMRVIIQAPNSDIVSGYRLLAETATVESLLNQGATLTQLVTSNAKYAIADTYIGYINEGGLNITYSELTPETSYTAIVLLTSATGTTVKSATLTTSETVELGDPTEVEITTLTQGEMDYWGDAYNLPSNDYANWAIYLAASTVDLATFDGTGDILMLELNTAKSVTTEITPGTYTIGGRAAADFKAFTCVPGYASGTSAFGTWFGTAGDGFTNPMTSGTVEVSKDGDTYTFKFELLDVATNKLFKGTYTGELTYVDYTQASAPAKVAGKGAARAASRKMVELSEFASTSLSANATPFAMNEKVASSNLLGRSLKARRSAAEFQCGLSAELTVDSAFGLRKFSAVGLMSERKTIKIRAARNE